MASGARQPSFWVWFAVGTGGRPGWINLVQPWLIVDLVVGLGLGFVADINVLDASRAVLFPLVSIFVAVSVAWAGNAHSLILSREIKSISLRHPGGFVEYVYPFQLGMLVILVTISLWAIAAIGIDVSLIPEDVKKGIAKAYSIVLFFVVSLSVRVTWQTVCLVLNLLIYGDYVKSVTASIEMREGRRRSRRRRSARSAKF